MDKWRYPGLQLDEDMPLQAREWLLQRITWGILYALLLAIVLGALGSGPMSHTVEKSADGSVTVEYERFMRRRAPETMRVTAFPFFRTVRLSFDSEFLRQIEIKRIVPEPDRMVVGPDYTFFEFEEAGPGPMEIAFHFQPERAGALKGWVALDGRQRLLLKHFVYP